jgi:hypothetical protein
MSAEVNTGGPAQNSVPKDGGNTFTVYFSGTGMNEHMQGSNLTDRLRDRGVTTIGKSKKIWDFGGGVGGPIKRDRLWFYTAHRYWGSQEYAADVFYNKTQGTPFYTPDLSRQGFTHYPFQDNSLRLTLQAASKHRLTASHSVQRNCMCQYRLEQGIFAPEAVPDYRFSPDYMSSGTWTYAASNRLLIQAGAALMHVRLTTTLNARTGGVNPTLDDMNITDLAKNLRYNAPGGTLNPASIIEGKGVNVGQHNERFSVSYVTGSHNFKAGFFALRGVNIIENQIGVPQQLNYHFNNGVPVRLMQWAGPVSSSQSIQELALFVQDQWAVGKWTLGLGARFDRFTGLIPEQDRPAGKFVPALHVDRREGVPSFTDLSPRVGIAYDLFGNGKTAIKGSVGRYLGQFGVDTTFKNNPANALVVSALRTWADRNGNYHPDCNLYSFEANGECGALDNQNFGSVQTNLTYAPDVITGFGNREYNWQTSLAVQHELRPGIGVTVGYFRTWFGNFVSTDNLLVTPADFTPYCVTAPVDKGLPNGGGYQICDLADVTPSMFGKVQNLVTQSSHYGKRSEVFNGVDTNVNARFGQGGLLQGGVSWGRTATQCVVVDGPVQFCNNVPPFRPEFKFAGIYPLPFWGLQASATFQQLPGAPFGSASSGETEIAVNRFYSSAEIKPSLGRDLAAGPGGVALVTLVEPNKTFEDRFTQVDVRLTKNVRVGRARVQGMFDVYNILNSDAILAQQVRYGSVSPVFRQPRGVLGARMLKLGVQLNF